MKATTTLRFLLIALLALSGMAVAWTPGQTATLAQSAYTTVLATDASPNLISTALAVPAARGSMLILVVGSNGNATFSATGWTTAIHESGTPSQAIFYRRADGGETSVNASVSMNPGSVGLHVYEYVGANAYMGGSIGRRHGPLSESRHGRYDETERTRLRGVFRDGKQKRRELVVA